MELEEEERKGSSVVSNLTRLLWYKFLSCAHTHIYTTHKCAYIYTHKNVYMYVYVCVFHIYVFTYFILIESHSGLHLLSMKLLFGNNWTPQIWISYLNFMNNIIVLISLTHPGSSPTRFTCLSEFVCNHSVTLPQKAESFRFHFSTRDTQSPPNTTDCAEIAL